MTMICPAKNKTELKAKLDAGCLIEEPTPWGANGYRSESMRIGFVNTVVLDPQTRRRFARIEKTAKGWKVT